MRKLSELIMQQTIKIQNWLLMCAIGVISMIMIGGYTRLTDSGLSIVEWRPVTGALPPFSLESWEVEFGKYQNSPEYQKINQGFSLEEFKSIYYVEYFHRLVGRFLGLLFVLPFFYFLSRGYLIKRQIISYSGILCLLSFQGFMGWYMVKSGLISNPHVSHFRLAAHLITASILLHIIVWEYLLLRGDSIIARKFSLENRYSNLQNIKIYSIFINLNIYIQIASGALVAGLDAGLVYNTFPLMDGKFIPNEFSNSSSILDIFASPGSAQFIHRLIAYFLLVNICFFCYRLIRIAQNMRKLLFSTYFMLSLVLAQFSLGIATLLFVVPIQLALLHQLCGVLLLITSVYILYTLHISRDIL